MAITPIDRKVKARFVRKLRADQVVLRESLDAVSAALAAEFGVRKRKPTDTSN